MEGHEEPADFGTIPFDIFALEHWDYSAQSETDQQQWDTLVHRYLSLVPKDRFHYHLTSQDVFGKIEAGFDATEVSSVLTPEKTSRALQPFQTAEERRIGLRLTAPNCGYPVWLRLCYDPDLEERYADLEGRSSISDGGDGAVDRDMVLDNANLYNLGPRPGRDAILEMVLRRIPAITDNIMGSVIEDYEGYEMDEISQHPSEPPIELASLRAVMVLYVVDNEAVEEDLIKLFWMDVHGRCVWSNKVEPSELFAMRGCLLRGYSLSEVAETYCTRGNDDGCGVYQQLGNAHVP